MAANNHIFLKTEVKFSLQRAQPANQLEVAREIQLYARRIWMASSAIQRLPEPKSIR
jgi:hypothetical protein